MHLLTVEEFHFVKYSQTVSILGIVVRTIMGAGFTTLSALLAIPSF